MKLAKVDIENAEFCLADGIKKSDTLLLDRYLHDELLFMAPTGQTITKQMDMATHLSGEIVVDKLVVSVEQINIIGDTAISTTHYDTKGKISGKPVEGKLRYIRVWKLFDNELKVIAASCAQV